MSNFPVKKGFAVLLGSTALDGGGGGGPSDILWILSLCFLGGAFVFSVLVIVLFSKVPFLDRYVAGYQRGGQSLKVIEKKLKQRIEAMTQDSTEALVTASSSSTS